MAIEFLVEFRKRYRETLARDAAALLAGPLDDSPAQEAQIVSLERVRQSAIIRALDAELARRDAAGKQGQPGGRGGRRKKKPSAVILPFPRAGAAD